MKIEIDIYSWPKRGEEEPQYWQGDAYVDGEWISGWAADVSKEDCFTYGYGVVQEYLRELSD